MRRAFLVNSDKCIGCRGCAMACKSFNQLEPDRFWRYVYPLDKDIYPHEERAFYSLACNHCEHPACVAACPVRKPIPNVKMAWWCITLSAALAAKTVFVTVLMARRVLMKRRVKRKNAVCATSVLISV